MGTSRREQILVAMETQLKTIEAGKPAGKSPNTYTYTIPSVQRWEQKGQSQAERPFIVIVPSTEEKLEDTFAQTECTLIIDLQVWATHDYDNMSTIATDTYINGLLSDVEKALTADRSWGGLADETHITGNAMFEDDTGQMFAGVIIEVEVKYKHRTDDPDAFV